jgi:hypothetical protein
VGVNVNMGWEKCLAVRDGTMRLLVERLSQLDPSVMLSENCLVCGKRLTGPSPSGDASARSAGAAAPSSCPGWTSVFFQWALARADPSAVGVVTRGYLHTGRFYARGFGRCFCPECWGSSSLRMTAWSIAAATGPSHP